MFCAQCLSICTTLKTLNLYVVSYTKKVKIKIFSGAFYYHNEVWLETDRAPPPNSAKHFVKLKLKSIFY